MPKWLTSIFTNLRDVVVFGGMIIFLFLTIGILPQVGLGFFIAFGGGPMLLPLIALIAAGRLWRGTKGRFVILVIVAAVVLMANMRGFYFHPFPTGRSFFSANRLLSNVMFALAFMATAYWETALSRLMNWKRQRSPCRPCAKTR